MCVAGFISIDCGSNRSYTEQTTGLNYTSDENLVDTGELKELQPAYKTNSPQPMWTLRSFPRGKRNCYTVNITNGTKYLIRASFLYGNYDGLNSLPKFDIHLGPNLWDSLDITDRDKTINLEIIHVATNDQIQICLVQTGGDIPFISALEFRPLKENIYVTESASMLLFARQDLGSTTGRTYR